MLNLDARGISGPSLMFETSDDNLWLIRILSKSLSRPVTSSVFDEVYAHIPNYTDFTAFRGRKISGFNFAFIDDHFDYHTVRDNYARLDRNSLAHQGRYLTELLDHFADTDLRTLDSDEELVYFNVPLFKMVSYPYNWGWFLIGGAWLLFELATSV